MKSIQRKVLAAVVLSSLFTIGCGKKLKDNKNKSDVEGVWTDSKITKDGDVLIRGYLEFSGNSLKYHAKCSYLNGVTLKPYSDVKIRFKDKPKTVASDAGKEVTKLHKIGDDTYECTSSIKPFEFPYEVKKLTDGKKTLNLNGIHFIPGDLNEDLRSKDNSQPGSIESYSVDSGLPELQSITDVR